MRGEFKLACLQQNLKYYTAEPKNRMVNSLEVNLTDQRWRG